MARKIAYQVLLKYFEEGMYLNIELNNVLKNSDLKRNDKDLITNIVYGTVQNLMYLEYQLAPYIKKVKLKEKTLLLMSLYQLIFLDRIPEYAVINEAVELSGGYSRNFINGVLRNFVRNGVREVEEKDELRRLSINTSHPLWMIKMLVKQYDLPTITKVLETNNLPPLLSARVNTLKITREELLKDSNLEAGKLSGDAVTFKSGNIANSEYYKNGLVTIQDESSQLVARLLNPAKNSKVLDMCGAPGSKTTHLSALMENTGHIDVYDLFEHKIDLINQNIERLGCTNISSAAIDSTTLDQNKDLLETYDYVLLDAPCTGLGVVRRKPEIKYHSNEIMDELLPLQAQLLETGYNLLAKNGIIVYSTCTLNKKENEQMIAAFMQRHSDIVVEKQQTIMPYSYDSDGFFMCRMKKGN